MKTGKEYCRIVLLVISCLLLSSGCGAKKDEPDQSKAEISEEEVVQEDVTTASSEEQSTDNKTEDQSNGQVNEETDADNKDLPGPGGNPYVNDTETNLFEFEILVSEGEYIYQNSVVELESFIEVIEQTNGDISVIITENNATQRAYSELVKELQKLGVSIVEQGQ